MSVTNPQDFKGKIVSVELKNIAPHERYSGFSTLLAITDYMLPSNGILTEQAMALGLLMHPIVVIRFKKSQDRYLCIGGFRSLQLAKSSLSLDTILSVTLIDRPRLEEIELAVNADILLSPLLMSIRSPATIGAIYQQMSKDEIETLLIKGMQNKTSFSEITGYAKNTIFPPKSIKSGDYGNAS